MMMKKIISVAMAVMMAMMMPTSCSVRQRGGASAGISEEQLKERAAELCKYIPDHELREGSHEYLTKDFYTVLDTLFNHLPEHEAMDHEWMHYFVTGNGGTIVDYEVVGVEMSDDNRATATIKVRQSWEDGSFDETTDIEEHQLTLRSTN